MEPSKPPPKVIRCRFLDSETSLCKALVKKCPLRLVPDLWEPESVATCEQQEQEKIDEARAKDPKHLAEIAESQKKVHETPFADDAEIDAEIEEFFKQNGFSKEQ